MYGRTSRLDEDRTLCDAPPRSTWAILTEYAGIPMHEHYESRREVGMSICLQLMDPYPSYISQ